MDSLKVCRIIFQPILNFHEHLILLQGELLKQGRLDRSYTGVGDCVKRTLSNEGVLAFWRGNFASVVRYFPQQVVIFFSLVFFFLPDNFFLGYFFLGQVTSPRRW